MHVHRKSSSDEDKGEHKRTYNSNYLHTIHPSSQNIRPLELENTYGFALRAACLYPPSLVHYSARSPNYNYLVHARFDAALCASVELTRRTSPRDTFGFRSNIRGGSIEMRSDFSGF